MLSEAGRLMGDLTVARLDEDRFWLTGSYYLQDWHRRWFRQHLAPTGVDVRNVTDDWMGFSISGPESRRILERLTTDDVSNEAFGFLTCRPLDVVTGRGVVGRISLTGELGYEITVPTGQHLALLRELVEAGNSSGLRLIGDRAVDSLRLEKGYGIWSTEFTQAYTPGMSRLDRFVAFDKGTFIGCAAARRERETGAAQLLVLLEVDAAGADVSGDEGVWLDGRRVGFVTSGAYGHHVRKSLALAYVDREVADAKPDLTVHVVGDRRTARFLPEPPYDPRGSKIRDTFASTAP
jgi:dimethylglycine dehydrogenase